MSSAGASVERATAGADGATRDVEASRARLASMQARLKEAQANATRASRDLERMKQLIAKDEISQQQYDAAIAQYRAPARALASAYDVPYLDFNASLDIPNGDFHDLSHLVEPGRVIWQKRLAQVLTQLLAKYHMGGGGM